MQGEAGPQLRAWVEYFRELGVHDFYRRGEVAPVLATEAGSDLSIQPAAMVDAAPNRGGVIAAAAESAASFAEYAAPAPHLAADSPAPQLMKLISFNNLAPLPAERIPPAERAAALRAIQDEIGDCTRCPLAYAGRHKIVFGDGSPTARLMFVGEGPGADEDAQGLPFVGKAGQLLNNMIAAMGLARAEVYIANIVKCRPPGNRVPEPEEANTCSQFLLRQIDVVQPEAIVALGSTAAIYLLGVRRSLSALRGYWHTCRGAKLAVTYHPAFLLRDPRQKAEAWKDLQMVMAELGLTPPARK
jgi:DNA polymerase